MKAANRGSGEDTVTVDVCNQARQEILLQRKSDFRVRMATSESPTRISGRHFDRHPQKDSRQGFVLSNNLILTHQ